jgi:hypothetical protein
MSMVRNVDFRFTREVQCSGNACLEYAVADWYDPMYGTWNAACWEHFFKWHEIRLTWYPT